MLGLRWGSRQGQPWAPVGLWRVLLSAVSVSMVGCSASVREVEFTVEAVYPHDRGAFTQGLVYKNGLLYESTGRYGASSIREVELESGRVLRTAALDSSYFGEGLAVVGTELFQLTWKEGVAFVYDLQTFQLRRSFRYEGEGWGLCYDGRFLLMSDGTATISVRDAGDFSKISHLDVTSDGQPVEGLNELECVRDRLFANVYPTNHVVQIDRETGRVVGRIEADSLRRVSGALNGRGTQMNGIAYDEDRGVFLLTGKEWGKVFAVRLVDMM